MTSRAERRRRTDLAWRTFGRADETQPQASGRERRHDPRRKTRALLGFIEDMEAAAVKNELERNPVRGAGQKVQGGETATETATLQFGVGSFGRKRGDIDAKYVEVALRQPNGIRPRTRRSRALGLNATRSDELDEQRLWLACIPGKLSHCVTLVPGRVRHHSTSAMMVERRFFGGLEMVETAALLGVSEATVLRDWRAARAWLARALRGPDEMKM
jgi:hypothetical protein